MAGSWKSKVVHGALFVLAVWPLAQMWLAHEYDISSWKLMGWGMYAEPRFSFAAMEAYGRSDRTDDFERLLETSKETATEAHDFLQRYRWLRNLVEPEEFAELVFAERPEWNELRVELFRRVLVRETGMVELRQKDLTYRRPE